MTKQKGPAEIRAAPIARRVLFIPEIISMILVSLRDADYIAYKTYMLNTQSAYDDVVALDLHAVETQVTLSHAALTCRAWNQLATELLYKRAILTTPANLWSFAETICADAYLARLVSALVLLDTPQKQVYLVPPLADLVSGEPSRIRYQTGLDLIRIVRAAPALRDLGAHYGREESLFCEIKGTVFTELSKLNDLRALSIDGTLTCPVLWMTPQGVAQHMPGFAQLEELSFHELFCDLRRLELPNLRTLTLRGCRCQYISWIIPESAPRLERLTLADNLVLCPGFESHAREALARAAGTLKKLTMKGAAEWKWFRSGDWDSFSRIERMAVGYTGSSVRLDCRHLKFPPRLRELVVFQPTSRFDVYLGADERHLIHMLETDAASPSCWGNVRIDAVKDLTERPTFQGACERLQRVCLDHDADFKLYIYAPKQNIEGKLFHFVFPTAPACVVIWTHPVERDHELALSWPERAQQMKIGYD